MYTLTFDSDWFENVRDWAIFLLKCEEPMMITQCQDYIAIQHGYVWHENEWWLANKFQGGIDTEEKGGLLSTKKGGVLNTENRRRGGGKSGIAYGFRKGLRKRRMQKGKEFENREKGPLLKRNATTNQDSFGKKRFQCQCELGYI